MKTTTFSLALAALATGIAAAPVPASTVLDRPLKQFPRPIVDKRDADAASQMYPAAAPSPIGGLRKRDEDAIGQYPTAAPSPTGGLRKRVGAAAATLDFACSPNPDICGRSDGLVCCPDPPLAPPGWIIG